jgi:ubiquinone/menaquinone biosynthesis C-methylase UbiE
MSEEVNLYQTTYSHFEENVLQEIRSETYGEDIGQNSWTTAGEYLQFKSWLQINEKSHVLEVGCGSGGPAKYLSQISGSAVTGIDISADAIAQASASCSGNTKLNFLQTDGSVILPFAGQTFDALICIDAINHLGDRPKVFSEWRRVVKPGGRILFSDPVEIHNLISNEELKIRSSIGYFVFPVPGINERLLQEAGFQVQLMEEATENMARVSLRWKQAREKRKEALLKTEDEATYEGLQKFLSMVNKLAADGQLKRMIYIANS